MITTNIIMIGGIRWKKIIPFRKKIDLEKNIYEIDSISLEHTLSLNTDNLVSGNFIISGTCKTNQASVNLEEFNYNLPFEISIDKKYDTKNVTLDIDDFNYKLDNKVLSIDIDVLIDGLEENNSEDGEVVEEGQDESMIRDNNDLTQDESETKFNSIPMQSIFNDLDNAESYVTYKVHIVSDNDTVESILQKYKITSKKLEAYNDLTDLKIGSKIIIPTDEQV